MSEDQITRLMNQGKQNLQARKFDAAKQCFEEVIRDQPNTSEAFYFLSWIAHTEKQPLSACGYLERAYELEPQNKNYLIGLANIYNQSNKADKTVQLLQKFLESDSSDADVYFQYACALAKQKDVEPALEAFKKTIELKPGELASYMTMGDFLYQLTRFREAHSVYLDAHNKGLKGEGLSLNMAKLHVDFGEFDQAKAILAQAANDYPNNLVFSYRLASLDKSSLTPDLKEKLLGMQNQALAPDQQFFCHWLLANFSGQGNEPLSQMESLAKAHKIYQSINRFERDPTFYLEKLPEMEPPVSLPKHYRKNASNASPVFVVGVPRCGSTLIENILCAGPTKVLKGEETGAFFQAVTNALESGSDDFWGQLRDQVEDTYERHELLDGDLVFTDKSLENLFLLDFIFALYPKAKVIYCDRAPLASTVSIVKNNMAQLSWAHDIDNILRYVDNCLSAADKLSEKYGDKVFTVQYEALVTNPVEESKRIFSFCNLPWDESCLDFHKAEGVNVRTASHIQVRKEINQDAVSAFEVYKPFFEPYKQAYPWLN